MRFPRHYQGPTTYNSNLAKSISDIFWELGPIPHIHSHGPAMKIVKIIINSMAAALHRGEDVNIPGFGIFKVQLCPTRQMKIAHFRGGDNLKEQKATNPPQEVITLPARKRVIFKPSKVLIRDVNQYGKNVGKKL